MAALDSRLLTSYLLLFGARYGLKMRSPASCVEFRLTVDGLHVNGNDSMSYPYMQGASLLKLSPEGPNSKKRKVDESPASPPPADKGDEGKTKGILKNAAVTMPLLRLSPVRIGTETVEHGKGNRSSL